MSELSSIDIASIMRGIMEAPKSEPDLMIMSYEFYVHMAASQRFGHRVNRSNRHKYRREVLRVMQETERRIPEYDNEL